MSGPASWLDRLRALAGQFSAYGVGPELAGLALADAWWLCLLLQHHAGGAYAV